MFNFFRKKKKNDEENTVLSTPQPQSATAASAPVLPPSGALKEQYNALLQKHRDDQDQLPAKAKVYTTKNNYDDKNEWIDALAICDVALDTNKVDDTIKELYRQIYTLGGSKHVSMEYDNADYRFWFETNVAINDRFIQAGVICGYCEQADLYGSSRKGFRNLDKKFEYLRKGVEAEDPASLGDYGYGIFVGLPEYGEMNKEEGRRLIDRSKELGHESAEIYQLYADFYSDVNAPDLLEKIEKRIEETTENRRKPYHLLADYYLRHDKLDKAVEAMEKGVKAGGHYSEYLLGMNYLNGRIENADKHKGIELLENAHRYGSPHAAGFLGQYYLYAKDENSSQDKGIEWHTKSALYCYAESSFELACIYLYNENYKNIPKGLQYLEQSIEDGSDRGLSEKAYLILETEHLPDDPLLAKDLLIASMEKGNEYAPYRLGLGYQRAEFEKEEPDYETALGYFEIGAEKNHLYSLELSGNYYRVGVGGESEEAQKKAVDYLTRACDMNSDYARVELALCHEVGWGVERDYNKAFDLFKEAADNNYPYANTKLATYYEDGVIGEPNLDEAFKQYGIAAEAGIADAIYNRGRFYKYAVGMPENPTEAMQLFEQAAEAGSASGLVEMGLAYEQEYAGLEFDAKKAMGYMMRAAEMNYAYAQYKVGSYYYYGFTETDMDKAFDWYTKSYEQGYPYAALMLGDFYLYNIKGEEEVQYEKAVEYYRYAETQGIISDGLGVCFDYGLGVEESETEAFKYYTLAANEGYAAAKYRLGLAYKYWRGTSQNLVDAYRWLSDAAQNGNYNAQYEMAMMLINGEGVGKDEAQGVQLLTQIADEDHDMAQFELGNCYLSGKGVTEDEVQAMFWYQKAADNGNEQAQKITGRRKRHKR